MRVLGKESAAALDSLTLEKGIFDLKGLISNAGKVVADCVSEDLCIDRKSRILVVCGTGNNGADGLAAASVLRKRGYGKITILLVGSRKSVPSVFSSLLRATAGIRRVELRPELHPKFRPPFDETIRLLFKQADLILDALFGTGLNRSVTGLFQDIINLINEVPAFKVSVDIPSGMPTDSSEPIGSHVIPDLTVTIGLPKMPLILHPLKALRGKLVIRNIGFKEEDLLAVKGDFQYYDRSEAVKDLLPRPDQCHKNDFGHLAVWAGSLSKTGAAFLSSQAAIVSGTGLVTTFCDKEIWPVLATKLSEVMVVPLEKSIPDASAAISSHRTILIGPGLGENPTCIALLEKVLSDSKGTVILDADALNILARRRDLLPLVSGRAILTPHMGEMTRLLGKTEPLKRMDAETIRLVDQFAKMNKVVVVLKSSDTLVFGPDTDAPWVIGSGNVGLAKAGSGDVLAGLVSGVVCQFEELSLRGLAEGTLIRQVLFAAFVHGAGADLEVERVGKRGLLASGLIGSIARVFKDLEKQPSDSIK